MLAAELIAPLVVPNSLVQPDADADTAQDKAAEARRAGPDHDPPGRGHRPQRVAVDAPRTSRRSTPSASGRPPRTSPASVAGCCSRSSSSGMLLAWIWRFRPGLWHRDNVLVLIGLLRRRGDAGAQDHGRPSDPALLPADRGHRDPPGDPARRVDRHDRHRDRGHHRRGGERRVARVRGLHLPGRHGRHRGHPQGRSAAGLRQRVAGRARRERPRRHGLLVTRRARSSWRPRAVVRLGCLGGRLGRGRGRDVRGPRVGVRDPDGVPAAGAGQPIAAAAAPAAGRDARHVPPLADGRQPGRTRGRGDRRGPADDPRGSLLPRCRQAREPARVHREPGRRGQHPRPARPGGAAPGSSSSTWSTASTWPTSRGCRRRSSRSSRSTTGPRS